MSIPTTLTGQHEECGGEVIFRPVSYRRELLAGERVRLTAICRKCGSPVSLNYALADAPEQHSGGGSPAPDVAALGRQRSTERARHESVEWELPRAAGAEHDFPSAPQARYRSSDAVLDRDDTHEGSVTDMASWQRDQGSRQGAQHWHEPEDEAPELSATTDEREPGDGEAAYLEHFAQRFEAAREAVRRVRDELPDVLSDEQRWARPSFAPREPMRAPDFGVLSYENPQQPEVLAQPQPEPQIQPEPQVQPQPETLAQPQPEPQMQPEPESHLVAEPPAIEEAQALPELPAEVPAVPDAPLVFTSPPFAPHDQAPVPAPQPVEVAPVAPVAMAPEAPVYPEAPTVPAFDGVPQAPQPEIPAGAPVPPGVAVAAVQVPTPEPAQPVSFEDTFAQSAAQIGLVESAQHAQGFPTAAPMPAQVFEPAAPVAVQPQMAAPVQPQMAAPEQPQVVAPVSPYDPAAYGAGTPVESHLPAVQPAVEDAQSFDWDESATKKSSKGRKSRMRGKKTKAKAQATAASQAADLAAVMPVAEVEGAPESAGSSDRRKKLQVPLMILLILLAGVLAFMIRNQLQTPEPSFDTSIPVRKNPASAGDKAGGTAGSKSKTPAGNQGLKDGKGAAGSGASSQKKSSKNAGTAAASKASKDTNTASGDGGDANGLATAADTANDPANDPFAES